MIVGDPSVFAIESYSKEAYERLSFRALGFFVIHVKRHIYGVRSPDSTMLACSFDAVKRRVGDQGKHAAPFAAEPDAGKIADAVRYALYADNQETGLFFGMTRREFSDLIYSNRLLWAPDGDEAFDDGSYVLQFDIQDRVRVIAFKSHEGYAHDSGTLNDVWLASSDFYGILQHWYDAFAAEWA